jgi:predicted transcriptional regulator YheO
MTDKDTTALTDGEPQQSYVAVPVTEATANVVRILKEMAAPLAAALGKDSEVVIHDLSLIPDSIVAVGGELTGRSEGGPVTDLLLEHLKKGRTDDLIRYKARHTDGRVFRSSTVFARDEHGRPFASLCINTDLTDWEKAVALIASHTATAAGDESPSAETFSTTVGDLSETLIERAIASLHVPVELMQKQHKLAVVRELEDQGIFLIKDSVDTVAAALAVTRFTIYNYLNEIREQ